MTTTPTTVTGRRWAYIGIVLGGAVSIAANVAHSFIAPTGAPATWHPEPGAVVGAIVWPVFLFIAIEILARTPWPTGMQWRVLRWGGLLPVAAVAAFVSYRHLSGLLAHYGEESIVTMLGPIAVDGLMAMATGALLAASHHTTTPAEQPTSQPPATPPAPSTTDTAPATPRPAATKAPAKRAPAKKTSPATKRAPAKKTTPAPVPVAVEPTTTPDQPDVPSHQVPTARFAVTNHHATTGRTITAPELAARMSVTPDVAGRLLALFEVPEPKPAVTAGINGTPTGGGDT